MLAPFSQLFSNVDTTATKLHFFWWKNTQILVDLCPTSGSSLRDIDWEFQVVFSGVRNGLLFWPLIEVDQLKR
jgi:hypothetical protein